MYKLPSRAMHYKAMKHNTSLQVPQHEPPPARCCVHKHVCGHVDWAVDCMPAAHLYKLPSKALSPGWWLGAPRSDREASPGAVVSAAVSAVPVWLGGRAAASPEQERSAGVSEDRNAGEGLADACARVGGSTVLSCKALQGPGAVTLLAGLLCMQAGRGGGQRPCCKLAHCRTKGLRSPGALET